MTQYNHSVSLEAEKCIGCTTCLKRCPTEAIRIRNGKAVIKPERCIDCGECIRVCPSKAKKAVCDPLEITENFKWKIALPAPALYGQFENLEELDYVLNGLLHSGFDDVFEVANAAEIVSEYTRMYLHKESIKKPIISSACPAIVRIIKVRFPSLCDNVLPLLPPIEIAAKMAKKEAKKKHPELKEEDIGVFFISPCPAKVSYVRNPIGIKKSDVDGVISMSEIYFKLISVMKNITNPEPLSKTGLIGISWAGAGGEAAALFNDKYLAADGIENVITVLDQIENGNISGIEFVELNACNGGCVGGSLTVENPYISKARLQNLRRYLPVSRNHVSNVLSSDSNDIPEENLWECSLKYEPVHQLDEDLETALKKMADIQGLKEKLPKIDCGSCGAPSCIALAEDIVNGEAKETDCIIKWREFIQSISGKIKLGDSDNDEFII